MKQRLTLWISVRTLALWVACVAFPAVAMACPYCAGQNKTPGFYWILGALVFFPFPTALAVFFAFKRAQDREES
jgi:hypothetical protein